MFLKKPGLGRSTRSREFLKTRISCVVKTIFESVKYAFIVNDLKIHWKALITQVRNL